jgi:hypothetical protein
MFAAEAVLRRVTRHAVHTVLSRFEITEEQCRLSVCLTDSTGRVLLDRLIGPQLVNKFPTLYRTRRFITTFTKPRLPSLP